jgi:hypothetical protein
VVGLWVWLFLLLGIGIVAVIFVRKRLMGGGNDSAYEAVVDTAAYDPYFTGGATPSYGHGTPDWQQGIAGSTTPVEPVYDSPYTATPVSSTSAPGANNLTPNPLQATDVTAGLVAAPATYKDDETVYSGTADWQKGIGEDETASDTSPTTAEPVIRDVKGTEAGLSGGRDIMDAVVANASDTGDGQVPDFEFGDSNESILASAAKIRSKKSRKSRSKDDTAAASAEDANSDDLAADDDGVMVIDHTK